MFTLGSSVGDDVKWKSAIERALGTWESVVEWADYISFLARVQKAVKNKYHCVGSQLPLAPQISEMLARCWDPALPSGVHQTCIDVYDTIFTIIGPQKLSETISIWLPGLLPMISWAAFNVKPLVIQLFRTHVVPAVAANPAELRELYRPLQLALLPSIEDETADCFTEIIDLLTILKTKQSDEVFFWRCFYLCVLTSPDCRMGALTFINKNSPSLAEPGFLIRGVCCGLEDSNVLVQRGFLDVLAKYLPLDSLVLQTHKEEFDKVILSACRSIFRKDMSLNRRLRLWLLGPDPDSREANTTMSRLDYLRTYGAERLCKVLLNELDVDPVATCSIARGLTDRWELGAIIAPPLLMPVLLKSRKMDNVPSSFSAFFDNIESSVVWGAAIKLLESDPEAVLFMVRNYNIMDEEMQKVHIPLVILFIVSNELTEVKSRIVEELLKVLPKQELPSSPENPYSAEDFLTIVPKYMEESYEKGIIGESCDTLLISRKHISWYFLKLAGNVVLNGGSAHILNQVLSLFPPTPGLKFEIPQTDGLISQLNADSHCGVELFAHLVVSMNPQQTRSYVQCMVKSIAQTFIEDGPRQLEKIQELWKIHEVVADLVVSSALAAVLADRQFSAFDRAKIFSGIWVNSIEQSDISAVLTKPTLLFLDISKEDKSLLGAYLQSSVVRTGTAARFVKLLVDKVDAESREDDAALNYTLEKLLCALENSEIRTTYITKFAPLVCTLVLEWFDQSILPKSAYAHALELAEITVLDHRIKDGKVWLRRFADALINSYIDYDEASRNAPDSDNTRSSPAIQASNTDYYAANPESVPVSLVKFVTAAVPILDQKGDIRLFAEACVRHLESEVDYDGFGLLLHALLHSHSDPTVEESLLKCIVAKLSELGEPLMAAGPGDIGDSSGVLHLISAMESIILIGLNCVKDSMQQSHSSGGLTGAIAGFHLESPEDRSLAAELQSKLDRCIQVVIRESCKFWLFLNHTRETSELHYSTEFTTALHTTGRLKTRLRKLMSLCHVSQPTETLQGVMANITDPKKAVRMIHMFEGPRHKKTLEMLFKLSLEDASVFDVAAAYVDSMETDLLGDVWPILPTFLSNVVSNSPIPGSQERGLAFVVQSIMPRLERINFKNRKKHIREFSDIYAKLLVADIDNVDLLGEAIHMMPNVVVEPDRQGSLLSKVQSLLFKSPKDIAKHAKLMVSITNTFGIAGTAPTKVWTRLVGDFLFETRTESDIIGMNLDQSVVMEPVISTWVACEKDKVKDFVSKLSMYGSSNVLFAWSGTQETADANLRRLAYMTICSSPTNLAVNWSKVINQLSALWTQNAASVCVLLRACVLKQMSMTLMAFMTFRIQAVFRDMLNRTQPISGQDAQVFVEACKLVDLALTVNSEHFQLFEWLFISDNGDVVYSYGEKRRNSVGGVDKDADEKARNAEGGSGGTRAGGILEKLVDSPALPRTVAEQLDTPTPEFRSKRRPLLAPQAKLRDMRAFLGRVSLAAHEEVYALAEPDIEYCKYWLLSDIFGSPRAHRASSLKK